MERDSKEYYENQSEYWFNEASKFVKQRDILIDDNAKLRKERAKLKQKFDDVVELFNTHLHHKKAWSDNPYYDRVQQRLNKIIEEN